LLFVILFAVHAYLRLFELEDRIQFTWDQVQNAWIMKEMLIDGAWPFVGMIAKQNAGLFVGPAYYYLLVPFYALFHLDPIAGGFFAAFQNHLGRIMGFAVILEIGITLLAVSAVVNPAGSDMNLGILFIQILPRGVELGLWSLALVVLARYGGDTVGRADRLRFRNIQGLGRQLPIASLCLVIAQLSLVGLPLLAGFPAHRALWLGLASESPILALTALLGYGGALFACFRTMAVLVMGPAETGWQISETWNQTILLVLGGFALILIGIFPQWFLPLMSRMAELFPNLGS